MVTKRILMPVVWKPEAELKLNLNLDWCYYQFGKRVANRFYQEVKEQLKMLARFPRMAPIEETLMGLSETYRSLLVHPHFKLIYYIDEAAETIYIVDMWDVRRAPIDLQKDFQ